MNLTDDEKRDAAMGLRALAYRAIEDGKQAGNPGVQATFENTAQRYTDLAAKFEAARTTGSSDPRSPRTPPSSGSA